MKLIITKNFPLLTKKLLCFASYCCFTLPSAGALLVCYKCSLADLVWQWKQSWARGRIRSLINAPLSTHFHQNSTILDWECPPWQVGNGHSHDGMALKRQGIPKSARLRREDMAPAEHHPKYNSHWAGLSRNSPNIPSLTLNQSPEDISSICAVL